MFTRGNDAGIKHSMEFLGVDTMEPGDVFIINYPYWSSAHTLDPLVFAPVHAGDQLIGFASCRIHITDLNQKDPGYVLDSTDKAQEGLMLPASKLYRRGERNEDVFNIIRFNSRMPKHTIGDIQAQVSAVVTGVRRSARELRRTIWHRNADRGDADHPAAWRAPRSAQLLRAQKERATAVDYVIDDDSDKGSTHQLQSHGDGV